MCPKTSSKNGGRPTEGKKKILFLILPLVALCIGLYKQKDTEIQRKDGQILPTVAPKISNVEDQQCVPPAINEFPDDLFTQEQRRSGFVAIHFVATIYLCLVLAIVCDQFFVPTLEIIAESLNVPVDVAGATFMAIGTSSPELYSAVIGSFVTEGDIGIGTIVGSAVFNILGVTAVTGLLLWNQESSVDWFPISRDSLVYIFSVTTLICIIQDNVVTSVESVLLLMMFGVYIAVMYFNSSIKEWGEGTVEDLHSWWKKSRRARASSFGHRRSLSLKSSRMGDPRLLLLTQTTDSPLSPLLSSPDSVTEDNESDTTTASDDSELDDDLSPWSIPQDSSFQLFLWLITWPALVLLTCTIPSCKKPNEGNYVLTFISSVIWIGVISYMCSWMVTIISHTFGLPDSVAGITILAAGISVPEIIASIIVVKSGSLVDGASSIVESLGSAKYLQDAENILKEDKNLSDTLGDWLEAWNSADEKIQEIFGFGEASEKWFQLANVLQEFSRIQSITRDFKKTVDYIKSGEYSTYIATEMRPDQFLKLCNYIEKNPQIPTGIRIGLIGFNRVPAFVKSYWKLLGREISDKMATIPQKYKAPTTNTVAKYTVLRSVDVAVNFLSLLDVAKVIKEGKSKYSNSLKEIIDILELELKNIEGSQSMLS